MLSLYLQTIGILAPGINSWQEAAQALQQPETYAPFAVPKKLETLLPANERRRASRITQLALYAAEQTGSAEQLRQCLQVFCSSNGDVTTFHQISQALTMEGRPVSPTRFHNSVHNAPAGYWSIATESQTQSTSLTAYKDSFSAGLLETAVQLNASDNQAQKDCLLVCYDETPPAAFSSLIETKDELACALRFSLKPNSESMAQIILTIDASQAETVDLLSIHNAQSPVLILLDAIANKRYGNICLPYFEHSLNVRLKEV
jgi:hypothetical protein